MKFSVLASAAFLGAVSLCALSIDSLASGEPARAGAQEAKRNVTVTASGSVTVPASYFVLNALVKENADITEEALADFGQSKARMETAYADAGLAGFSSSGKGLMLEYMPEPKKSDNAMMGTIIRNSGEELLYGVTCKEAQELRFALDEDAESQHESVMVALDTLVELGLELEQPPSASNSYMYINGRRVNLGASAVEGGLDDEPRAAAEKAAQAAAMKRAVELANPLAELSSQRLGVPQTISLQSLDLVWKGIGIGFEVTASVRVAFELL